MPITLITYYLTSYYYHINSRIGCSVNFRISGTYIFLFDLFLSLSRLYEKMENHPEGLTTSKVMILQDTMMAMDLELNSLDADESIQIEGFKIMFKKFISKDEQERVVWDQIRKPAQNLVSWYPYLAFEFCWMQLTYAIISD